MSRFENFIALWCVFGLTVVVMHILSLVASYLNSWVYTGFSHTVQVALLFTVAGFGLFIGVVFFALFPSYDGD